MPIFVYLLWSFIAPGWKTKKRNTCEFLVPGATLVVSHRRGVSRGTWMPPPRRRQLAFLSTFQVPQVFKNRIWARGMPTFPSVTIVVVLDRRQFSNAADCVLPAKLKIVTAACCSEGWRFAIVGIFESSPL